MLNTYSFSTKVQNIIRKLSPDFAEARKGWKRSDSQGLYFSKNLMVCYPPSAKYNNQTLRFIFRSVKDQIDTKHSICIFNGFNKKVFTPPKDVRLESL